MRERLAGWDDPHAHGRPRPRHTLRLGSPEPMAQVRAEWTNALARLDFAFQPIVNIHTGYCFGYEALLRNHADAGFASIGHFFDACHAEGVLPQIEAILHEKILRKFTRLEHHPRCKLFLNLDNRLLSAGSVGEGLDWLLDDHGLGTGAVCFEISERHPLGQPTQAVSQLQQLKRGGFKLAVDDFGTGFSGLQMLYQAEPDLIKIDRFFITDIASDSKKKLFLTQIVNIAHLLGAVVVAEGVETEQEYFVCKDIGCDLVQGYLVQRPTLDIDELALHYPHIQELAQRERRAKSGDQRLLRERIEAIPPLTVASDMETVFERFRGDKTLTHLPIVDETGEPLGIVRERDLKELVYSRYGKELMSNRALGRGIQQFLVKCPVVDINASADNILQTFSAADSSVEGIVMIQDMKYAGFLSMRSLLQVINDKNLQAARDQNPLTRLPGNNLILEHLSGILPDDGAEHLVVYFDFDNFKPFNDKYGFRLGDRAILLFAELLVKRLHGANVFLGHIGGDDFFVAFRGPFKENEARVRGVIAQFGTDVQSFYDEDTRRAGFMTAQDRDGAQRRFPLLGVSAAMLHLPCGRLTYSTEEIGWLTAALKKSAKSSDTRTCAATLLRGR